MRYRTPIIRKLDENGLTVYRTALENEVIRASYQYDSYDDSMTECYITFINETPERIQELVNTYNLEPMDS